MSDVRTDPEGAQTPWPTTATKKPGDQVAPGTPHSGENVCRTCGGAGRLSAGGACPDCAGTGRVTELLADA